MREVRHVRSFQPRPFAHSGSLECRPTRHLSKAPRAAIYDFWQLVPALTTTDANMYIHSDGETPETVPWTGLEATTRAYAMIIDEVNNMDISDLQRPEEK